MAYRYVFAFLFDHSLKKVWLIEKQKPKWQKGLLNGIGGKTELGETSIQAIVRELREEAGISINQDSLVEAGLIEGFDDNGDPYEVVIFTGTTALELITQEQEQIGIYHINEISAHPHIENLALVLQACLYKLTNESANYSRIILKYDIKI